MHYSPRVAHCVVRGSPSFHERQGSSTVLINTVVLFTGIRDVTVQERQSALGGFPKFFPWCGGCCVLNESTAVAICSHTGEESTLG